MASRGKSNSVPVEVLNWRELEILDMVKSGVNLQEIGRSLNYSRRAENICRALPKVMAFSHKT